MRRPVRRHSDRLSEDTIADLEAGDAAADCCHLSRHVASQDGWIVEPWEDRAVLKDPVDRVDGDRPITDKDFILS